MNIMKKLLLAMAASVMALSCTRKESPKILVLYYSQNGGTKVVAEEIGNRLGADIAEIVPVCPYDGHFEETIERCRKEMEAGEIPEIEPVACDLKAYDVVFLGYPVWFGTYAPPVAGLLTAADFSGKKIVPFCTFGSGGLDSSVKDLKEKEPEAEILPGYGVRAARIEAVPGEVDRFLKEGGFIEGEYEKYGDFSEMRPASEAEAVIFDAAVAGYPMIHATAKNVSSRAVTDGTEYLFEAEDAPDPRFPGDPRTIKVYVLDLEGQEPVFTQVLR